NSSDNNSSDNNSSDNNSSDNNSSDNNSSDNNSSDNNSSEIRSTYLFSQLLIRFLQSDPRIGWNAEHVRPHRQRRDGLHSGKSMTEINYENPLATNEPS